MKVVDQSAKCSFCNQRFPLDRTQCPHCAQPQLFPNVGRAELQEEKQKLNMRYNRAKRNSEDSSCEVAFNEFERACNSSVAVFKCSTLKLFRAIATGTDLFETFHDLESLRIRLERPSEHDWQKLRPQAEIELLGTHHHLDKLHYAALSLDGEGLDSYGDCAVILADEMIRHRASCFEGNSGLIFEREHGYSRYLRSTWADRAKLCVAKTDGKLAQSKSPDEFPNLLLRSGSTQDDDEFVEVHVFGTMTAHTFGRVSIDVSRLSRAQGVLWKAVKEKLAIANVTVCEK